MPSSFFFLSRFSTLKREEDGERGREREEKGVKRRGGVKRGEEGGGLEGGCGGRRESV